MGLFSSRYEQLLINLQLQPNVEGQNQTDPVYNEQVRRLFSMSSSSPVANILYAVLLLFATWDYVNPLSSPG